MKKYAKLFCGGVGLFLGALTLSCNDVYAFPPNSSKQKVSEYGKYRTESFRDLMSFGEKGDKDGMRDLLSNPGNGLSTRDLTEALLLGTKQAWSRETIRLLNHSMETFNFYKGWELTPYSHVNREILETAIARGDVEAVKGLFENLDWDFPDLDSALRLAFKGERLNVLKFLYENVDKKQSWPCTRRSVNKSTVLWAAAEDGSTSALDFLISQDPSISKRDLNYMAAFAASYGKLSSVQLLFNRGADDYERALFFAALENHLDVAQFLIDKVSCDLNRPLLALFPPLTIDAKRWYNRVQYVSPKTCRNYYNDPLVHGPQANGPFVDYKLRKRIPVFQLLIDKGANKVGDAFVESVKRDDLKLVEFFYSKREKNISTENWNDSFNRAVVEAAKLKNSKILKCLVGYGATDAALNEALNVATDSNNSDMILFLQSTLASRQNGTN